MILGQHYTQKSRHCPERSRTQRLCGKRTSHSFSSSLFFANVASTGSTELIFCLPYLNFLTWK